MSRSYIPRLGAAMGLLACSGQRPFDRPTPLSAEEVRRRMLLFGHRGSSAQSPENTKAAFVKALTQGAHGVECDLQRLQDETVVLHDQTLRRTASNCKPELLDAPVESLSFAEVQDIDVGSWYSDDFADERLLTFKEFLAVVKEHDGYCLVEVKGSNHDIVDGLLREAKHSGICRKRITFISFDLGVLQSIKKEAPEYCCYGVTKILPSGIPIIDEWRAMLFVDKIIRAGLDGADFNACTTVVTSHVVKKLHDKGLKCAVWVPKDPAENDKVEIWQAMEARGVDLFTSNCSSAAYKWWGASESAPKPVH